jgi:hypothetical protein
MDLEFHVFGGAHRDKGRNDSAVVESAAAVHGSILFRPSAFVPMILYR